MANSIRPVLGLMAASSMRPRYSPWGLLTAEPTIRRATSLVFCSFPGTAAGGPGCVTLGFGFGCAHPQPARQRLARQRANVLIRLIFIILFPFLGLFSMGFELPPPAKQTTSWKGRCVESFLNGGQTPSVSPNHHTIKTGALPDCRFVGYFHLSASAENVISDGDPDVFR